MSTHLDPDGTYARLLALLADPYSAYRETTDALLHVQARIPGLQHTRRPGDAVYNAAEALRVELCAVLRARQRLDQQAAEQEAQAAQVARWQAALSHRTVLGASSQDDGPIVLGGHKEGVPLPRPPKGPAGPDALQPEHWTDPRRHYGETQARLQARLLSEDAL